MNFGQAIKELRIKKNMTQVVLAERIGMSVNAVSSWELGKTFPPNDSIKRLCKAFEVPQSYLLAASIEEEDVPEDKRVLYRAMLEPFRKELLKDSAK